MDNGTQPLADALRVLAGALQLLALTLSEQVYASAGSPFGDGRRAREIWIAHGQNTRKN